MEGVEVQRVIDVLILHLGLPVGGAVVTSLQSVDLSISAMGDKGVLLHRVEIICERKEKSSENREGGQIENIVSASALRITSTTIDLNRFSTQTQLHAL